jgi:hypothetical protein
MQSSRSCGMISGLPEKGRSYIFVHRWLMEHFAELEA